MSKKILLTALLCAMLPTVHADNKPKIERSLAAITITSQEGDVPKTSLLKRFADSTKNFGTRLGKNAWLRTKATVGNTYHLWRHPINTLKRVLGSAKLQLRSKKRLIPLIALISFMIMNLFSLRAKVESSSEPGTFITLDKKLNDNPTLHFLAFLPNILLAIQAFYDNNLSSAQLRTKNWFRRLAGWLFRHRLTTPFGYDRGSVQNTEMLLKEYAALPTDADENLRTIYHEELQDMQRRWECGSEDANEALQARVAAALNA